jgi:hypothetical protein
MSEFICTELMYEIMKQADPHTYVQLIRTCHEMNQLGKSLCKTKVEESLRCLDEPNRTCTVLPNGQLHGIATIIGSENIKHYQTYYFGVLMAETVNYINIFGISKMNNYICSCLEWESHLYTKIYDHEKGKFLLKITHNGEIYYEGEFLIATNENHGTVKTYDKKNNISSYEIFHKDRLFYSESFVGDKIFQKIRQLDEFNYQIITYRDAVSLNFLQLNFF